MARTVGVSGPSGELERLLHEVRGKEGVVGLTLQRGASIDPPGDVLTIQATNDGAKIVMRALDHIWRHRLGTITTSEPHSLIAIGHQKVIERENNEGLWEETVSLLRRDSNPIPNYLSLMAVSGAVAGAGLWTDTLHLIVGAMLLAPGFEPLARIPFALIAGPSSAAIRGLVATVAGYLLLAAAAACTAFVLQGLGSWEPQISTRQWVQYWTTLKPSSLVALIAGAGGAIILASQRTVFAGGVIGCSRARPINGDSWGWAF